MRRHLITTSPQLRTLTVLAVVCLGAASISGCAVLGFPPPGQSSQALSDPTSAPVAGSPTEPAPTELEATMVASATVEPTTPPPTPTAAPTLTPIPPVPVHIAPGVPAAVTAALSAVFEADPQHWVATESIQPTGTMVAAQPGFGDVPIAEWTYALVTPFPTVTDGVAWADITSTWSGVSSGPFAGRPLLMSADTATALAALLGEPAPGAVQVVSADELVDLAWATRPAWAVVPFEHLEPRWKVLRVDDLSPIDRDMDVSRYPLTVRVGASGAGQSPALLAERLNGPLVNRDPSRMAVVLMTGVTALTRGTSMRMDRYGPAYPAEDILHWLLEPDITHISDEVAFAEDCPPATNYTTLVFCSNPTYIGLLEVADIDVVELTGNHLLDWGVPAMELTLRMFDERALPYYGGGWTVEQAQAPLMMTVGEHTFGFVGCNPAGPRSDWATDTQPGSAPCDYELLKEHIRLMREGGVIPIVTLQYLELDQTEPSAQQRADFRALSEAGAVIVSGSQAHQPQGFDFDNGAFIHYGLGNLFFDQMWSPEMRREFLDRHVFYAGRHISTEVLTAMLEDYSRPRPMTSDERAALLSAAFAASGW